MGGFHVGASRLAAGASARQAINLAATASRPVGADCYEEGAIMCDWSFLTKEAACNALREAGLELAPAELRIEAREARWAVSLPGEQMAWFPANEGGRQRLSIERRVLRLLADRCSFSAPRVLFESASGYDVRAMVSGLSDPWGLYERTRTDTALARRIGRAIGAMLIEQHARIANTDVAGWLPERVDWPEPGDWVRSRLPRVLDDPRLISRLDRVFLAYEQVTVPAADRVLVHGDLGLHNIAVDPVTTEVRGVFDYDGAAWADRHHDFRYLIFHSRGDIGGRACDIRAGARTQARSQSNPALQCCMRDRLLGQPVRRARPREVLRPNAG
jgi:hypothetical protein